MAPQWTAFLRSMALAVVLAGTMGAWVSSGPLEPEDAEPEDGHWAYRAPELPRVPADPFGDWARNPLDAFVARTLAARGLEPSEEASREALIRRATLDLTGLPPSLAEVDAFLDDDDPDAYERLIERLLASPAYGEHQAREWLDLARYADSDGYEKDDRRTAWRYRDWVIEAFNRDLPFDRFTIEQLAGDLLPEPSVDQLVATGFHRNTMVNKEGGTDPEEWRVAAVKDRVETTAQVWLGTTMECAQCHDHKYDPFSQEEYYGLFAFFNQTEDTGNSNAPEIEAPRAEEVELRERLLEEKARLEEEIAAPSAELAAEEERWADAWEGEEDRFEPLRPRRANGREGTRLAVLNDGSVLALGDLVQKDVYEVHASTELERVTSIRLEVLTDPSLPEGGPGRPGHRNFVLNELVVRTADEAGEREVALASARADFHQTDRPWRAEDTIDGDLATGWAIAGAVGRPHQVIYELAEPLESEEGFIELRFELHQLFGHEHLIGRFRLSVADGDVPAAALGPVPAPDLTLEERPEWFRARAPRFASQRERLAEIEAESDFPTALVMREREERRPSHVLAGGSFLSPEEEVDAGVPSVLGALTSAGAAPLDRLDFARWLVSPANPLTARVVVNRLWQRVFGIGLVATTEDFGTRGERPSHPDLLDWLALEIQRRDWSLKELHRLILTSATYRQSSRVSPELLEQDPGNRFLARGPRVRLEAEGVRDAALFASGLLCEQLGGPSVYPPQPEGTWMMTYNADKWETSEGCDRYRRGLYTFWRRTAPYPTFMLFDATSRELACVRRDRSNTPLQALATLNDPAFFECAVALARRMVGEGGETVAERARHGFRLCTSRTPDEAELALLIALYEAELEAEVGTAAEAGTVDAGFVDDGDADPRELAAWIAVANALLNLDETITKG